MNFDIFFNALNLTNPELKETNHSFNELRWNLKNLSRGLNPP